MLNIAETKKYNVADVEILTAAYDEAALQLRYSQLDCEKRLNLGILLLRLAEMDGVREGRLVTDAVAMLTRPVSVTTFP